MTDGCGFNGALASSEVARALIGKSEGGVVEVMTPSGAKTYKIIEVAWLNCDTKKWKQSFRRH